MGLQKEIKKTHPHIMEWFEKATKDMKQDIIAKCFEKGNSKGPKAQWVLTLEDPFSKRASKGGCVFVCAPWEPIELQDFRGL